MRLARSTGKAIDMANVIVTVGAGSIDQAITWRVGAGLAAIWPKIARPWIDTSSASARPSGVRGRKSHPVVVTDIAVHHGVSA